RNSLPPATSCRSASRLVRQRAVRIANTPTGRQMVKKVSLHTGIDPPARFQTSEPRGRVPHLPLPPRTVAVDYRDGARIIARSEPEKPSPSPATPLRPRLTPRVDRHHRKLHRSTATTLPVE